MEEQMFKYYLKHRFCSFRRRSWRMRLIIMMMCFSCVANALTTLNDILNTIQKEHPQLRMYDADIRSMDEAAKGARSWMPLDVGAGFWMTPYNPKMWKAGMKDAEGNQEPGMGQFMLSAQQMFPNKQRQNASDLFLYLCQERLAPQFYRDNILE